MRQPMNARSRESGQALILGLCMLLVFLALATALVDGYALVEARNWGYQVAQQAALAGVSAGRRWDSVADGCIELDEGRSLETAVTVLESELAARGMSGTHYDVRSLPEAFGGSLPGFPPQSVRLAGWQEDWTVSEPAVGIYLSFPIQTFLLSFFGRSTIPIYVFASASVAQPAGGCLP